MVIRVVCYRLLIGVQASSGVSASWLAFVLIFTGSFIHSLITSAELMRIFQ